MKIPSGGILGRTKVLWEDDQPAGTVGDDGTEGGSSTALADAMATEALAGNFSVNLCFRCTARWPLPVSLVTFWSTRELALSSRRL